MNNIKYFLMLNLFLFAGFLSAGKLIHEEGIACEGGNGRGSYVYHIRIFDDPEKINEYKKGFSFPEAKNEIEIDESKVSYDRQIDMGQSKIVTESDELLYTSSLVDCIGLSVWEEESKTAALYHVSKMELRDMDCLFKDYFLKPLMEKLKNPKDAVMNLVSSFWSRDVIQTINLMKEAGFSISGLSIPDAVNEEGEDALNTYVDASTVSDQYKEGKSTPNSAMWIDAKTGKMGFSRH